MNGMLLAVGDGAPQTDAATASEADVRGRTEVVRALLIGLGDGEKGVVVVGGGLGRGGIETSGLDSVVIGGLETFAWFCPVHFS